MFQLFSNYKPMKKYYALLAVFAVLIAVACNTDDGKDSSQKLLSVTPLSLDFEASGNLGQELTVTAQNVEWTYAVSASGDGWITVTPDGNKLTVTVTDNPVAEPRSGVVTIKPVDDVTVKSIGVTVTQKAGTGGEQYSLTVKPESLSFAASGAEAQQVTVETSSAELGWTVAPEGDASWIHAVKNGNKIDVTVDDYSATTPRAGKLIITPDKESASPKSVKVVQAGKTTLPFLSVTPDKLSFDYKGNDEHILSVQAVDVEWNVTTSDTADGDGDTVAWLHVEKIEANMAVSVKVERNELREQRSGYVVVTSSVSEVPNVVIAITQDAGEENKSNLTADVEITDMNPAGGFWANVFPAQMWDDQVPCTYWAMELWGDGLTFDKHSSDNRYTGSGSRMVLNILSNRIKYNYDEEYFIPEGEYAITRNTSTVLNEHIPFTIKTGQETNNMAFPSGAWYVRVEDGAYVEYAPLVDGKMTVAKEAGDVYTFTFDFVDDAGHAITGTFKSKITDLEISFFEDKPDPDPNPDPDPDPDFPTE